MTFHSLVDPFTQVNEAEATGIHRQLRSLEAFRRACNRAATIQAFLADLGLVLPNTPDARKQAEHQGYIVTPPVVIGQNGAQYQLKSGREALKNGRYYMIERIHQLAEKHIPVIHVTVWPDHHCRVATYAGDMSSPSLFEKSDTHLTGLVSVVANLLGQDDDIGSDVFKAYIKRAPTKSIPESLQKHSHIKLKPCRPCATGAAPAPMGK